MSLAPVRIPWWGERTPAKVLPFAWKSRAERNMCVESSECTKLGGNAVDCFRTFASGFSVLIDFNSTWGRGFGVYRGASPTRKRTPLGPWGGGNPVGFRVETR